MSTNNKQKNESHTGKKNNSSQSHPVKNLLKMASLKQGNRNVTSEYEQLGSRYTSKNDRATRHGASIPVEESKSKNVQTRYIDSDLDSISERDDFIDEKIYFLVEHLQSTRCIRIKHRNETKMCHYKNSSESSICVKSGSNQEEKNIRNGLRQASIRDRNDLKSGMGHITTAGRSTLHSTLMSNKMNREISSSEFRLTLPRGSVQKPNEYIEPLLKEKPVFSGTLSRSEQNKNDIMPKPCIAHKANTDKKETVEAREPSRADPKRHIQMKNRAAHFEISPCGNEFNNHWARKHLESLPETVSLQKEAKKMKDIALMKASDSRWKESHDLLQDVLQLQVKIKHLCPPYHNPFDVADTYYHLGIALNSMNEFDHALDALYESLSMHRQNSEDNIHVASVLSYMGMIKGNKGDYEGAICNLKLAQIMQQNAQGHGDPTTLRLLNDFLHARDALGQSALSA